MSKVNVSVEVEYYSDERLQRVIDLLESRGFEREPNREDYDIVPMGGDTTVVINGVVTESNRGQLETVKDVVKVHRNSDIVLFGKKS